MDSVVDYSNYYVYDNVGIYVLVGNYYSDHCDLHGHLIYLYYSQSPRTRIKINFIINLVILKQVIEPTHTDSADPEPEDTVEARLLVLVDTLTLLLLLLEVK